MAEVSISSLSSILPLPTFGTMAVMFISSLPFLNRMLRVGTVAVMPISQLPFMFRMRVVETGNDGPSLRCHLCSKCTQPELWQGCPSLCCRVHSYLPVVETTAGVLLKVVRSGTTGLRGRSKIDSKLGSYLCIFLRVVHRHFLVVSSVSSLVVSA